MKHIYPDRQYSKLPTMTVVELIAKLQEHDPEMPVVAEWEGTWNAIQPERFSIQEGKLIIDVENH